MRDWMENNKHRNAKKPLICNVTGHMSVIIMQSLPYCLVEAANMLHEQQIDTIVQYLYDNHIPQGREITDFEIDIKWGLSAAEQNEINDFLEESQSSDNNNDSDNESSNYFDSSSSASNDWYNYLFNDNSDQNDNYNFLIPQNDGNGDGNSNDDNNNNNDSESIDDLYDHVPRNDDNDDNNSDDDDNNSFDNDSLGQLLRDFREYGLPMDNSNDENDFDDNGENDENDSNDSFDEWHNDEIHVSIHEYENVNNDNSDIDIQLHGRAHNFSDHSSHDNENGNENVSSDNANEDDDAKHEVLSDDSNARHDEHRRVRFEELADAVNNVQLPRNENRIFREKFTDFIDYHYKYKYSDDERQHLFDNNDNSANVLYSRLFHLAVMFDYCSLWRKVMAVFCTLKWPKNAANTTPRDIKRCQLWARSALYKASEWGQWLLHDYAWFAGGVGPYMLEAFYHYNPYGYGFYAVNQQMCEHWGNWMKNNRISVGNAAGDKYLYEIADNCDISVMGCILADMVDFRKVVKDETLRSAEVFDLELNDIVEKNALQTSPILFQMLINRVSQVEVNDEYPDFLTQFHSQERPLFRQLSKALKKQNDSQEQASYRESVSRNNSDNISRWRSRLYNIKNVEKQAKESQPNYAQ